MCDEFGDSATRTLSRPAVLMTVSAAGQHHDTATALSLLALLGVTLFKNVAQPLWEVIPVQQIVPPVGLRVVNAGLLGKHRITTIDSRRG